MHARKLIHKANLSEPQQVSRLQELRIGELNKAYQQQLRLLRRIVKVAREKRNLSTNAP
jgi:hypothetical protein